MHGKKTESARAGFTLIEISLVLLLFASAVGGLLSFFPVGLKLEGSAISDSAQTMFALDVLGQIEANAAQIDSWSVWSDDNAFSRQVVQNVKAGGQQIEVTGSDGEDGKIEQYLGVTRANIRYRLSIVRVSSPYDFDGALRRAVIWVTDRRDGRPKSNTPFSVDLAYRGRVADVLPAEVEQ